VMRLIKRLLTVKRCSRGVASLVVHRSDKAPLVRFRRVPLSRVLSHVSVVSAHRIDASVKHSHAHVAPIFQHYAHGTLPETGAREKWSPFMAPVSETGVKGLMIPFRMSRCTSWSLRG